MLSGLKVQIGSRSCEKSGDKSACLLRLCGILSGSLVANCSSQLFKLTNYIYVSFFAEIICTGLFACVMYDVCACANSTRDRTRDVQAVRLARERLHTICFFEKNSSRRLGTTQ